MKKIFSAIKKFFFPPKSASRTRKIMPYAIMGIITLVLLVFVFLGWDYTNSNEFCGTFCHTMPPQYSTYLRSPHAGVNCVDCHLGRAGTFTKVIRKVEDGTMTLTGMITGSYEYPLRAHNMRPANEACETCHYPEKFSYDSLTKISSFEENSTPFTTYLLMKTGGGSSREGLGFGIHWHIENEVLFYDANHAEQDIFYVRVTSDEGEVIEYYDIESDFELTPEHEAELKPIDCITCHNRTAHDVYQPEQSIDLLLSRELISSEIPMIKPNAVSALRGDYQNATQAVLGIDYLEDYYWEYYPEFMDENEELVEEAVARIKELYSESVFPEQGMDWESHPDNMGHEFSPGCFRCHDGKHLSEAGDAIRLECNICHSIPTITGPNDIVAHLDISLGIEPDSHFNTNWITLHRDVFDPTCESCHTVEDPGGVSNVSFCANSSCHGSSWEYAGFDAPALREALMEQLQELQVEVSEIDMDAPLAFEGAISSILEIKCASCHGEGGMNGLNVTSYQALLDGGNSGPSIVTGDAENSLLLEIAGDSHYASFSPEEAEAITNWITEGAAEK
ncbi:MAG: NapC/NirT family cytochrome c [Anaerolineaceae bacterium]|nr:NapC/NirT family cytochrome c [Anaerolineaceae bacterium]